MFKDDDVRFTISLISIEDNVIQTNWGKSSIRSIGLAGWGWRTCSNSSGNGHQTKSVVSSPFWEGGKQRRGGKQREGGRKDSYKQHKFVNGMYDYGRRSQMLSLPQPAIHIRSMDSSSDFYLTIKKHHGCPGWTSVWVREWLASSQEVVH